MATQISSGVAAIQAVADEWLQLWEEAQPDHPFCHPDWIDAYLRCFEPSSRVWLLTARLGGRLLGVLPLIQDRAVFHGLPVRRIRAAVNSHSFRFDILRMPGPEGDAVLSSMWNCLRGFPGWDVLEIPSLPYPGTGEQWLTLAQAGGFPTLHNAQRMLHIALTGAAGQQNPWQGDANSRFRKDLRRLARRAAEGLHGSLQFERVDEPGPEQMEKLFAIESSGWKGRQRTAISSRPETKNFYSAIAASFAKRRCSSLHFLKAGERTLSILYSLQIGKVVVALKLGCAEEYLHYSPGHLLFNEMAHDSWQRGFSELDLGPEMDYKLHWTRQGRHTAHCFIFSRHTYGRFLLRYKTRLRPAVKRFLYRVLGRAGDPGNADPPDRADEDSSSTK
ncbi:MAG: GNAT family N-acetyltransferase [Acidobacteriia bacterium]|nr:GNAT family N-acetyltransferase [Terriglobia bacterium]